MAEDLPAEAPTKITVTPLPPIRAQSADGVIHEFPSGTEPAIVDKAMKAYATEHRDKTNVVEEVSRGVMDPIEGGGQLVSNLLPTPVRQGLDKLNNLVAPYSGGLIRTLPPGGKNEQIEQREKAIAAERGMSADKTDWPRVVGNILSPVNYLPAIGAAGRLESLGAAAAGGAIAGLTTPVTDAKNYFLKKDVQTGIGALIGGVFGAAGAAVSKGVEKLGEYIANKNPEALENDAVKVILRRMAQDAKSGGPTATQAIELANASGKPMTLADQGGPGLKGLAGSLARKPGEASSLIRNFLTKRDNEAAERLSADIANYVHGGQTAHQATEMLLQSRSAEARPAYNDAFALQGVWSPRLEDFLQDPVIRSGLARGYELERLLALAEDRPITATQLGVDIDTQGNIKLLDKPNMRLLDMAKQGLDAMIEEARDPITGRLSKYGVALDKVRRTYRDELDSLDKSGVYRKAREKWAGYSASLDAIKLGRSALHPQRSPEENAAELVGMSESNREFVRLGIADLLRERLAKTGFHGDEAKQLIKNPWMRDQLRPFFKSTAEFDKFVDAVSAETKMFETGRTLVGGSQSAERIAEDMSGETAIKGTGLAIDLLRGHYFRSAVNAWRMYRDLGLKQNPEFNEKIAQIIFSTPLEAESRVGRKLTGVTSTELPNPLGRYVEPIAPTLGGAGIGVAATNRDAPRKQHQ